MHPLLLLANWKAQTPADIDGWLQDICQLPHNDTIKIGVLPPAMFINAMTQQLNILPTTNDSVTLGCQHFSLAEEGAFTGELPASMLRNSGVRYFLVGHSERRNIDFPSQETLTLLIDKAIDNDGHVVYCVGETAQQYADKLTFQTIDYQLDILNNIKQIPAEIIIAYEPRWAIGTGKTPSLPEIESCCKRIRKVVKKIIPQTKCTVLYGGSLKLQNCHEIFTLENVNGGLVGGASLDSNTFTKLYDSLSQSIPK